MRKNYKIIICNIENAVSLQTADQSVKNKI